MGEGGGGSNRAAQCLCPSKAGAVVRTSPVALTCTLSRDLPTFFNWEVPSPFQILPTKRLLEPGEACQIQVTVQPLMATVYQVQAMCLYGEGSRQRSSIQLQAAGEAPLPTHPQSPLLHFLGLKASLCPSPTTLLAPPRPLPASCPPPTLQVLPFLCLPLSCSSIFPWGHLHSSRGCSAGAKVALWVSPQDSPLCPSQMCPAAGEHKAETTRGPGCRGRPESVTLWLCCCGLHRQEADHAI